MKKPCIVIAGPTAAGKTEIALKVCSQLGGSVISADSMQIYKGLDIGSAKIKPSEMNGIMHYLIDELDPGDDFNVFKFKDMAKKAMEEIWSEGGIPVVTGGTGFYIQALVRDVDFTETCSHEEFRKKCFETARVKGPEALYERLKALDPDAAKEIHPNNVKRVTRALEYCYETGELISEHNKIQKDKESPYKLGYFVITDDREALYKRIDERVDKMIADGLEAEVKGLYEKGLTPDDISMKGIGYREFFPYFEGKISLDEVIENIKKDTRHFAKRQLTWFRKESCAVWLDRRDYGNDFSRIADAIIDRWREIPDD